MTDPHLGDDAEGPRDGHLRSALRHAPDAELRAPPALSAAILQQARTAVLVRPRQAAAPSSSAGWLKLLQGLKLAWAAMARPPVAAALASVMVATTLTLLWRDGLMQEPFDRPPPAAAVPPSATALGDSAPVLAQPQAAAPPTLQTGPTGPAPAAPAGPAETSPREPADALPKQPAAQMEKMPSAARTAPHTPDAKVQDNASTSPSPSPSRMLLPSPEAPAAAEALKAAPPAPLAAPAPLNSHSPSTMSSPGQAPGGAQAPQAMARAATSGSRERSEVQSFGASRALAAPASAPAPAEAAAASLAPPPASSQPSVKLAALPAELQADAARWSSRRDGGMPQATVNADGAWLQALAREADAAGARWQPAPMPAPKTGLSSRLANSADGPISTGPTWLLLRDGLPQHRFQLGEDQLSWTWSGRTWVMTLPREALKRLADTLAPATPTPTPTPTPSTAPTPQR